MKKLLVIIVALLLVVTLSACTSTEYINISNEELVTMLSSDVDYYFIDVRTPEEFQTEKIAGFSNINLYEFDGNHSYLDVLDTTRPIVVMCNSGNRSVTASKIFLEIGFTEVYNLENGIEGWIAGAEE